MNFNFSYSLLGLKNGVLMLGRQWFKKMCTRILKVLTSFLFPREVYHTKRMHHVICVRWTSDSKYIMCGSDEMNIRLWKANASEKLGVVRDLIFFHLILLDITIL